VLDELGDNQWKGFFQISKDLREKYDISVDPDKLEGICQEMVKEKVLEQDKYGAFFRKIQPTKK
jgi:lipoate-protein ligase A